MNSIDRMDLCQVSTAQASNKGSRIHGNGEARRRLTLVTNNNRESTNANDVSIIDQMSSQATNTAGILLDQGPPLSTNFKEIPRGSTPLVDS